MQIVYKYLANIGEKTLLVLPLGAKILTVQKQGEYICFWVLQSPNHGPTEVKTILKVGTGHTFDDANCYQYIGTVQELDGGLVWHYFEVL
jgi:hypothetical protein